MSYPQEYTGNFWIFSTMKMNVLSRPEWLPCAVTSARGIYRVQSWPFDE